MISYRWGGIKTGVGYDAYRAVSMYDRGRCLRWYIIQNPARMLPKPVGDGTLEDGRQG